MEASRLLLATAIPAVVSCAPVDPAPVLDCEVTRCEGEGCRGALRAFSVSVERNGNAVVTTLENPSGGSLEQFREAETETERTVTYGTNTPSWPVLLTLRYGPDVIEAQRFSTAAGTTELAICIPREAN